uniref:Uncharacterized protein n=1 Tax=Thermogemmatispora argillosa TaxID=2045280 RepID=A0A455SZ02_9CHLR|nr:hypothetical protein KTA_03110 [Thermogemmatispora argillosa]
MLRLPILPSHPSVQDASREAVSSRFDSGCKLERGDLPGDWGASRFPTALCVQTRGFLLIVREHRGQVGQAAPACGIALGVGRWLCAGHLLPLSRQEAGEG